MTTACPPIATPGLSVWTQAQSSSPAAARVMWSALFSPVAAARATSANHKAWRHKPGRCRFQRSRTHQRLSGHRLLQDGSHGLLISDTRCKGRCTQEVSVERNSAFESDAPCGHAFGCARQLNDVIHGPLGSVSRGSLGSHSPESPNRLIPTNSSSQSLTLYSAGTRAVSSLRTTTFVGGQS